MQTKIQLCFNKKRYRRQILLHWFVVLLIFSVSSVFSYDLLHFYHAAVIPYSVIEPIFDRDSLWSMELFLATGSGQKGENSSHNTVPVFDIFGTIASTHLADGVPNLQSNNQLDYTLLQLQLLSNTDDRFGQLSISAKIFPSEYDFFFTKVFTYGLFTQVHIPIRSCEVMSIEITDLTSTSKIIYPNKETYEWSTFRDQFNDILRRYNISLRPFDKTVLANPTILFGVTHSYVETTFFDFIDVTAATGITFNVTPKSSIKQVLAAPFFNRSFNGIPFQLRSAIGMYDWLTFGVYGNVTCFFDRNEKMHVTTSSDQQGMLNLAVTEVAVHKGADLHLCLYTKADHVVRGFSILFGYSYEFSGKETIHAKNKQVFPYDAINHNKQLKSWDMHTLHYIFAFDFSLQNSWYGPRVSVGYNQIVGGKRIIKSNLMSGEFGVEWVF